MKRAVKEIIRAGMLPHLLAAEQRALRVLQDQRDTAKMYRTGIGDKAAANQYVALAKAQIVVIRRIRHEMAAFRVYMQLLEGMRQAASVPAVALGSMEPIDEVPPLDDTTPVRWVNDGPPQELLYGQLDRTMKKTVVLENGRYVGGFPF